MASDRLFNYARWLRRLTASEVSPARQQRRLELWTIARAHGGEQLVSLYAERCGTGSCPGDIPPGRMIKAILDVEFPKVKADV